MRFVLLFVVALFYAATAGATLIGNPQTLRLSGDQLEVITVVPLGPSHELLLEHEGIIMSLILEAEAMSIATVQGGFVGNPFTVTLIPNWGDVPGFIPASTVVGQATPLGFDLEGGLFDDRLESLSFNLIPQILDGMVLPEDATASWNWKTIHAPIPEPASVLLLGTGLLGLAGYAWRRRAA